MPLASGYRRPHDANRAENAVVSPTELEDPMANTPANPGRSRKSTKSRSAATRTAPSAAVADEPSTVIEAAISGAIAARHAGFRDAPNRGRLIAEAAYYRAERRGFAPGHEVQDWLDAEREIDAELVAALDDTVSGPAN